MLVRGQMQYWQTPVLPFRTLEHPIRASTVSVETVRQHRWGNCIYFVNRVTNAIQNRLLRRWWLPVTRTWSRKRYVRHGVTHSDSDFKVTFKTSLLLLSNRQNLFQLNYDSIKMYLKTFTTKPKHIYTVQFDYVIARCDHTGWVQIEMSTTVMWTDLPSTQFNY